MIEASGPGDLPTEPPREIAIIRLSAIGDVLRALPVANALKRAYPDARITWIVEPLSHRLIQGHPAIDSFIVVPRIRSPRQLGACAAAYGRLRARRFDLALVLQTAFKAGIVAGLIDARVKLGFDRRRARELNWLFTNRRVPPRSGGSHALDEYLEFLDFLGIDPEPVTWDLTFSPPELAEQRRFFERLDRPACALVVGTSRPAKNWAPERYARLIEALESDFGFRCLLIGGPTSSERVVADRILAETTAAPVDALGDDVRRLAWLLAGSDLVISPDTGPLHIARALDVPVVALFGLTNPKRLGPYGKYQDLVVDGYARWPGEDYPCTREYRPGGMERIEVEAVLEKVGLAVRRYLSPAGPDTLAPPSRGA